MRRCPSNFDRFLNVAKFGILSLLVSCELLLPIVGFKMFSLPILASKFHNKIFTRYLGNFGYAVAQLVEALCYKPEGRGFGSR
jgi:hypothetical protein